MFVLQEGQRIETPDALAACLAGEGIESGCWALPPLEDLGDTSAALHQAMLAQCGAELAALKQRHGYLTEDIVSLTPETPGLDAILAKFDREHHHVDDEVRVVLKGSGIFGVVPASGAPYEIHVFPGDWIVIPAYTRHWFKLHEGRNIVALRVFKTPAGWEALYDKPTGTPVGAVTPSAN